MIRIVSDQKTTDWEGDRQCVSPALAVKSGTQAVWQNKLNREHQIRPGKAIEHRIMMPIST